jgi:serine/threonine protein phosphatase PrpC
MEQLELTSRANAPQTLADRAALQNNAGLRADERRELWRELLVEVSRAVVSETKRGHLLCRLVPEDVVYLAEARGYVIATDAIRYPLEDPPSITLTDTGLYAPETTGVIRGALSERAAVYNLGALLYHALTGLEPVAGFSTLARDLPKARALHPDLPVGVDPILRRAVARNPDQRWSSASEVLAQLEAAFEADRRRLATSSNSLVAPRVSARTDTGVRKAAKNPNNQDRYFVAYDASRSLGLFLVADGVSTCSFGAGDRAAELVVNAAAAVWLELLTDPALDAPASERLDERFERAFVEVVNRANAEIVSEVDCRFPGAVQAGAKIMASTATAAFLNGARLIVGNVGDSRVYLVGETVIDQVSVDGDRKTSLLRKGRGLDAVLNGAGLGELTACVGSFEVAADRDGITPSPVPVEFFRTHLIAGDRVLVCSDGLPDCMGVHASERMHRAVVASRDPDEVTANLIFLANEGGGEDNITCVLVVCPQEKEGYPNDRFARAEGEPGSSADPDEQPGDGAQVLREDLALAGASQ